ncbi:unnamed protein product [Euphydryas editha]|uniref:ATP synthase F0 subunit 8 n=1 Tax=Euphydryas editha TaxID=104508 RepID=A0AAU9UGE1_EUPED|nr:unnamed protein product [Euphydryas editha]
MPPYGIPNFDFSELDDSVEKDEIDDGTDVNLSHVTLWYMVMLVALLLLWMLIFFCLRVLTLHPRRGQDILWTDILVERTKAYDLEH